MEFRSNDCSIVIPPYVEVNSATDTSLEHMNVRSNCYIKSPITSAYYTDTSLEHMNVRSNCYIKSPITSAYYTDTSLEHMNVRSNCYIKSLITSAYYVGLPSVEIISASETSLEYLTFRIIMPHVYFQQTDW